MASISEFSLFDEPPKEKNECKYETKQKSNFDNIFPKNPFDKDNNIINSHSTTNDKTIQNTPKQKNGENIKEVSSFSLCENNKPLNRKLNFFSQNIDQMEIEDEIAENDSSMSDSPSKRIEVKEKNNKSEKTKSEDETEEEAEFKYIKRQSKNDFSFATPKFDEDYVIIKTLCEGEMGTVYLCMKFQDKKTYVVKMTNFFARKFDYYNMKNFLNCININDDLPGATFIQKYIDFWIEDIQDNNSKTGNKNMYIVTNYCVGGDLKEYLNKIKKNNLKNDKDFYWDIIFQMIASVSFLHKLGYVHFDIKPSNFLVQDNGQLLLSDFCLTIKEKDIANYSSEDFEGDSIFISPELFYRDKDFINTKTDIFSLGLSILQILTNVELPKNGLTWQLIRTVGIPKEYLDEIPYFNGDNQIFKNLITNMTSYRSQNRPDLESILNDKENYPYLYERYQLLLNDKYTFKFDLNKLEIFRRDSYDFSSSFGNFKKRFEKRSDSMKIVNYFKDEKK
jgi:serine/threonine protein kinase